MPRLAAGPEPPFTISRNDLRCHFLGRVRLRLDRQECPEQDEGLLVGRGRLELRTYEPIFRAAEFHLQRADVVLGPRR